MANQQLGPFELKEQLGAGGMGVVYRAEYTKTGQVVALKLLSPQFADDERLVARFQRELEILKKLHHRNIVQCFGGGRLGKQRFYAMELVTGGSLADRLQTRKQFPWQETIQYGLQICAALEHAHEHGIVHRDLKPANLMLDKQGNVKLADFGLARISDATALTAAGKTLGTFAYMAPEQISGKSPITPRTDLYALGCVLFEFLTGHPPFESDSAAELFFQHLKKKPPRVCLEVLDCPLWLESLILQLMEKDPEKRPRDSIAVAQALEEIEQKVAQNASVAQHSLGGQPTAINIDANTQEVVKLLKKKTKKKKKGNLDTPVFEQTWFLATCLLLLLAGVTWAVWPLSESQLFQRAVPLMATNDPLKWQEAREKYLLPLQERFPEGPHQVEVQEYLDRIEMQQTEDRLMSRIRRNLELKTQAEQLFAAAWRYEQFGDRITALEQYEAMAQLLKDHPEDRAYVNLARRQIAAIKEAAGTDDRAALVNNALERADERYAEGAVIEARKTWESIISLYENNRELEPLVERARTRLYGETPEKQDDGSEKTPEESP